MLWYDKLKKQTKDWFDELVDETVEVQDTFIECCENIQEKFTERYQKLKENMSCIMQQKKFFLFKFLKPKARKDIIEKKTSRQEERTEEDLGSLAFLQKKFEEELSLGDELEKLQEEKRDEAGYIGYDISLQKNAILQLDVIRESIEKDRESMSPEEKEQAEQYLKEVAKQREKLIYIAKLCQKNAFIIDSGEDYENSRDIIDARSIAIDEIKEKSINKKQNEIMNQFNKKWGKEGRESDKELCRKLNMERRKNAFNWLMEKQTSINQAAGIQETWKEENFKDIKNKLYKRLQEQKSSNKDVSQSVDKFLERGHAESMKECLKKYKELIAGVSINRNLVKKDIEKIPEAEKEYLVLVMNQQVGSIKDMEDALFSMVLSAYEYTEKSKKGKDPEELAWDEKDFEDSKERLDYIYDHAKKEIFINQKDFSTDYRDDMSKTI